MYTYGNMKTHVQLWQHEDTCTLTATWRCMYTYGNMKTHVHLWQHEDTYTVMVTW